MALADFPSVPVMAGFECSTHRRSDGARLDVVADTLHVEHAVADYRLLRRYGITTVREGLRWHLVEPTRGVRNWKSFSELVEAAELTSTEIIWDLLHFGFPDWVNPFHPDFPSIFAGLAADMAKRNAPGSIYVPVNEISFMAWAAGDVEYMYPYSRGRGSDLKRALCAASIAAVRAIKAIDPSALILAVEPMIAVHPRADGDFADQQAILHEAQFEAVDILLGRRFPDLGGDDDIVDIIGLNHYPQSQWTISEGSVDWRSAQWVKPSQLLSHVWTKYQKPLLLSETGCEGDDRVDWFRHIASECALAVSQGVPIMGLCLYPIFSHEAWTGERHCPNGLFDGTTAARDAFLPMLEVVSHYQSTGKII